MQKELIFISFPFRLRTNNLCLDSSPQSLITIASLFVVGEQLRSNNQQTSLLCYSITHSNRIAFISDAAYQIMMNETRCLEREKLIKSQHQFSSFSHFRFSSVQFGSKERRLHGKKANRFHRLINCDSKATKQIIQLQLRSLAFNFV